MALSTCVNGVCSLLIKFRMLALCYIFPDNLDFMYKDFMLRLLLHF